MCRRWFHTLAPNTISVNGIPKIETHGDWLIGTLVVISMLFATIVYRNRNLVWKAVLAAFFKQYYISLQREENEIYKKVSAQLNFISLLSLSLFIYLWIDKSSLQVPPWYTKINGFRFKGFSLYLLIFSLFTFFVFLQMGIIRLFAVIFNTQADGKEHEFNLWLIYKLLGIYTLPILFFISYSNNAMGSFMLYFSIILFALVAASRYLIGFRLALSVNSFPKIY